MKQKNKRARRRRAGDAPPVLDRHYYYAASVQSVDADIDFLRRVYRKKHGRSFRRLREDFCGTALLAADWVRRGPDHEAWGVDLDRATLDWGLAHWGPRLGRAAERLHLECRNVLDGNPAAADVVVAANFSYSVFRERQVLGRYFRRVRESLLPGGLFVIDAWGGQDVMSADVEERKTAAETAFDGKRVPAFTYIWEQTDFNPIDHRIRCHIHFRLRDGRELRRAFSYDWRLWMLPELRELMAEAGFASSEVYVDGWDDDADEADGVYRKRSRFENQAGWVAYVVACT